LVQASDGPAGVRPFVESTFPWSSAPLNYPFHFTCPREHEEPWAPQPSLFITASQTSLSVKELEGLVENISSLLPLLYILLCFMETLFF